MEIINLAGYSDMEKLQIAKRYLIPRQTTENGLNAAQLKISDAAIELMATRYTREAGVRQMERNIGSIARKVALKIAQARLRRHGRRRRDVRDYLGAPRFYPEQARKELPAGVATGMAWTEMGGEVLFIEATLLPGGRG
jgi:ATP-dependent Lon protease